MKILLINQFFWPDSAATSQFLTDLACELHSRGHEVKVLCADANYAQKDGTNRPPVRILRPPSLPFGRSKPMRLLSYISFLTAAGCVGLFGSKPDLVVTLTTPPLLGLLGTFLKYLRRVPRHVSWEMDLYPDILCDLGYFSKKNPLIRVIAAVANFYRRRADAIIALGDCMKRRLVAHGVEPEKIHVLQNWADGELIRPLPFPPFERFTVLYSGNLGLGHDVDTIAQAMLALRADARFRFIFAGGGGRRAALRNFCKNQSIHSVEWRDYCDREKLEESLAEGHVGLVTQQDQCSGSIVPSKVYGILAAGRPLLYIGPKSSTPAQLIRDFGCGWQIDCGDRDGLTLLLKRLAEHPREVMEAGRAARVAFNLHFDRATSLETLCSLLLPETKPARSAVSIKDPITETRFLGGGGQ